MLKKIYKNIEKNRIFTSGDSVVLGISGGADSVCLLIVLHGLSKELDLKLYAVHINHCLRGAEADADMEYVKKLCDGLGVRCFIYREDIAALADSMKCSAEEAGRYYRYKKFSETAESVHADKIAVAHNMNDNSETILFNLFRGTGIKGMCGIPQKRDMVVRPLLCVSRDEIEAFLEERHIPYRTDSTNFTDEYTRNKIRRNILTYVSEQINENVVENISRTTNQLREIEDFLVSETKGACEKVISGRVYNNGEPEGIYIEEALWTSVHPAIQKRVIRECISQLAGRLKDVTEVHTDKVLGLWELETGKRVSLPYDIYAQKTYTGIKIEKKFVSDAKENTNQTICIDVHTDTLWENGSETACFETPQGMFEISYESPSAIPASDNSGMAECTKIPNLLYTKWFDCDKINTDLQIRTRRQGDWIVIDDRGGRKKLKSFFVDMKIPKEIRDSVLLVADGSHILWIVGYRISAAVKLNADTTRCIKIQYKGENDGK